MKGTIDSVRSSSPDTSSLVGRLVPKAVRSKAAAVITSTLAALTAAGCTTNNYGGGYGGGYYSADAGNTGADAGKSDTSGGGNYNPGQNSGNQNPNTVPNACDGTPDFIQTVATNQFNTQVGNGSQALYGQMKRVMSEKAGTDIYGQPVFAFVENVGAMNNPNVPGGNILVNAEFHGAGVTHIGEQLATVCNGNVVVAGNSAQLVFGSNVNGVHIDDKVRTEEHRDALTKEIGQYASQPGATIQSIIAQVKDKHPTMIVEYYQQTPGNNWAVDCNGSCITVTLEDLNQKAF